jgi:hypothetical protein
MVARFVNCDISSGSSNLGGEMVADDPIAVGLRLRARFHTSACSYRSTRRELRCTWLPAEARNLGFYRAMRRELLFVQFAIFAILRYSVRYSARETI